MMSSPEPNAELASLTLPPAPAKPPRIGFLQGFYCLFSSIKFLFITPRAWPYAMVPGLLLILLLVLSTWLCLSVVYPWAASWAGAPEGFWGSIGSAITRWAITLMALVLSMLISFALTPPLSGPALEALVSLRERDLKVPPRAESNFLKEMLCGLRAQLLAATILLPIICALWIIGLLFPPIALITSSLSFICSGLGLAWSLLDYPLTLRDVRARKRFRLIMRHKAATLGFGLTFAALFLIPGGAIFLLPIGVVAATKLLWLMLAQDPLGQELGLANPAATPKAASQPRAADEFSRQN